MDIFERADDYDLTSGWTYSCSFMEKIQTQSSERIELEQIEEVLKFVESIAESQLTKANEEIAELRAGLNELFYSRNSLGIKVEEGIAEQDPDLWKRTYDLLTPKKEEQGQ